MRAYEKHLYQEAKAAQAAAFFLHAAGRALPMSRLMVLLYLSERESYRRYHGYMIGDVPASTPKHPTLVFTHEIMSKFQRGAISDTWNRWLLVLKEEGGKSYWAFPRRKIDPLNDLRQLSGADLEVLQDVWARHGQEDLLDGETLKRLCPEFNPLPNFGARGAILAVEVTMLEYLRAIGLTQKQVEYVMKCRREQAGVNGAFAGDWVL